MKYNKLVRDKVVENIKKKGEAVTSHIASEAEYWEKLREKLVEEAMEFQKDGTMEEIADVWEVIEAILAFKKFDNQVIYQIKAKKAEEKGKFNNRIILEEA